MIEEINSADGYTDESTDFEPPPGPPRKANLPWVIVGLCVLAIFGLAFFHHSTVGRANERALTAEKASEDLSGRLAKSEEDRKAAVRRATELTEKADEVTALGAQLKEKDAALTHLQQTQDTLVAKLHAIAKANKKVAKQIEAALPKASAPPVAKAGHPKAKKHGGRP